VQLGLPFESEAANVAFYFVRHARARRYVLRVDADGRVRVTIPRGGSKREAVAFGLRHVEWITDQRARMSQRPLAAEEQRMLRQRASTELSAQLVELATCYGLAVARVSIRDQRTRWGSCGRDGRICLNWRIALMPAWVRDYVIIHELMHLKRLDHSRRYWELVAAACPEYQAARRWLRAHGPSLR
jgi:hypothetical protein